MEHYRVESELSGLRSDVVIIGGAIVGALLLNAFLLLQISNDLHEVRKRKEQKPLEEEDETTIISEKVSEKQPVSEQQAVKETKKEGETENEKQ